VHELAEFQDLQAGFAGKRVDVVAVGLILSLSFGDEALPALGGNFETRLSQRGSSSEPW